MAYTKKCSKCGKVLKYTFEIEQEICDMCNMELVQGVTLPPLKQKGEQNTNEPIIFTAISETELDIAAISTTHST